MNWRKHGFTQKKPTKPGVYFVATDGHLPMAPARRLRERWDVADVIFFAGSYTNAHDNVEANAHWRISTLGGLNYSWRPGMWLKGPITPLAEPRPTPEAKERT
jgi:hypothetical protein